jgi:hypothetical protein
MAKARCPICGKMCRVAPDGKSGYCKTQKSPWKTEKVRLKNLWPGSIQHNDVDLLSRDMMKWSYDVVGRYLYPTLEQWELGFMRDMRTRMEVWFWHRIAAAFITYHRRLNLPLRSADEERKLIGRFVELVSMDESQKTTVETNLLESWQSPEGFEKEVKRLEGLVQPSGEVKRWTPPPQFDKWPQH